MAQPILTSTSLASEVSISDSMESKGDANARRVALECVRLNAVERNDAEFMRRERLSLDASIRESVRAQQTAQYRPLPGEYDSELDFGPPASPVPQNYMMNEQDRQRFIERQMAMAQDAMPTKYLFISAILTSCLSIFVAGPVGIFGWWATVALVPTITIKSLVTTQTYSKWLAKYPRFMGFIIKMIVWRTSLLLVGAMTAFIFYRVSKIYESWRMTKKQKRRAKEESLANLVMADVGASTLGSVVKYMSAFGTVFVFLHRFEKELRVFRTVDQMTLYARKHLQRLAVVDGYLAQSVEKVLEHPVTETGNITDRLKEAAIEGNWARHFKANFERYIFGMMILSLIIILILRERRIKRLIKKRRQESANWPRNTVTDSVVRILTPTGSTYMHVSTGVAVGNLLLTVYHGNSQFLRGRNELAMLHAAFKNYPKYSPLLLLDFDEKEDWIIFRKPTVIPGLRSAELATENPRAGDRIVNEKYEVIADITNSRVTTDNTEVLQVVGNKIYAMNSTMAGDSGSPLFFKGKLCGLHTHGSGDTERPQVGTLISPLCRRALAMTYSTSIGAEMVDKHLKEIKESNPEAERFVDVTRKNDEKKSPVWSTLAFIGQVVGGVLYLGAAGFVLGFTEQIGKVGAMTFLESNVDDKMFYKTEAELVKEQKVKVEAEEKKKAADEKAKVDVDAKKLAAEKRKARKEEIAKEQRERANKYGLTESDHDRREQVNRDENPDDFYQRGKKRGKHRQMRGQRESAPMNYAPMVYAAPYAAPFPPSQYQVPYMSAPYQPLHTPYLPPAPMAQNNAQFYTDTRQKMQAEFNRDVPRPPPNFNQRCRFQSEKSCRLNQPQFWQGDRKCRYQHVVDVYVPVPKKEAVPVDNPQDYNRAAVQVLNRNVPPQNGGS